MMEHITTVLWQVMDQVVWVCQTATKELGHFLWTEAIHIEKHQTWYMPLLTYMNEESICEDVQPWQQIIMFFAWTQHGVWLGGKRPWYGFTPQQRKMWQCLWECAAGKAEREKAQRGQEETMPGGSTKVSLQASPLELDVVPMACLDFCMELLNQCSKVNEYDCALVCAMAVMG